MVTASAFALISAVSANAAAQGRTLDWTAFHVDAHLDSTGRLQVREVQTIRFSGDWNGGERAFDVRFGQDFDFRRLMRVHTVTGDTIVLTAGDASRVDEFLWSSGRRLRWRSRLPDDPPFDRTEIVYVLEYEYDNILTRRGDGFEFDHEFAFRDREGMIENFTLRLTLDAAWRTGDDFTGEWQVDALPAGESFVVTIPVEWRGAGVPGAIARGASATERLAIAVGLAILFLAIIVRFLQREHAAARFDAAVPLSAIDANWLRTHVRAFPPELIGAAWDDTVGAPEVSAVIARMVGEQKLTSHVVTTGWARMPRHVLHLKLSVSRNSLRGYEGALIDALFAAGERETSTDTIRERYKNAGFNPAIYIRRPIQDALSAMPGAGNTVKLPGLWVPTLTLIVISLLLLVLTARSREADALVALIGMMIALGVSLIARSQAWAWRRRVIRPSLHLARVLIPLLAMFGGVGWLLYTSRYALSALALATLGVWCVALLHSVLNTARSRYTIDRMRLRKRLASARRYLQRELQRADPQLDDSWYPYLLAFGLHRQVARWFRAFGSAAEQHETRTPSMHVGASGGADASSGSSWSGFGGGGAFAGAGATVAFGAAIGGMASGVSAPSSSSSGGGGSSSSSGGSSGGGGGGGW